MQPRFDVDDEVKCNDHLQYIGFPSNRRYYLQGLTRKKKYFVVKVVNWSDGSQSIWVKTRYSETIRGPFIWTRFKYYYETVRILQYDPNQQGDTDEDI